MAFQLQCLILFFNNHIPIHFNIWKLIELSEDLILYHRYKINKITQLLLSLSNFIFFKEQNLIDRIKKHTNMSFSRFLRERKRLKGQLK